MWLRVFGSNEIQPEPAALLEFLCGLDPACYGNFRGDDRGWFQAEFYRQGQVFWRLERYLAGEEGIRADLNSWAAWLETAEANPNHGWLMEHIINARQLFTLQPAENPIVPDAVRIGTELCRYLARLTSGVYQVDGVGVSAADGTLLVAE
jgi:hypothetical protein